MAHPRKLLRHAIMAQLVGSTAAADRVESTRIDPIGRSKLPLISVYTLNEDVDQEESESTSPRLLKREAIVEIVGWVAYSEEANVADALDDLAEQIEAAMAADEFFGLDMVESSILIGTDTDLVSKDGRSSPLVGQVTMTYSVTYRTQPGYSVPEDDFLRVKATHQIVGGVDDTVPAEDEFTVQESP